MKVEVSKEAFWTGGAFESLFPNMDFDVFVQVGFLSKVLRAIIIRTLVRSLSCMNPQVIKEVVPFPEVFVTVSMFAFQDLYASL